MSYPFNVVVQHHEGAGAPSNNIMRFAAGGYTYGIGVDSWGRFRLPAEDYSTIDFNHVVVGVCLSGNRNDYPITDKDIEMMTEIAADAKKNGWLVAFPNVMPHKDMPGSNTVCPGDFTMLRWADIKYAYQNHPVPVPNLRGVLLTTVASPQPGNPSGRIPTARPIPELGAILLENGASLKGDEPSGHNRIWTSSDPAVKANGNKLIDITPAPNGVVALFDLGNGQTGTYQLEWS